MSNSFLIVSRDIFSENKYRDNLDNNAIIAYILLGDRMKLSIKNNLVDDKKGVHFIFYKINDLAKDMRKSRGVAVKALKQLKNVGLISKRRMYKESTHIFLPKFNFKHSESSKIRPHSNNKFINNKERDSNHDSRLKGVGNRKQTNTTKMPEYDTKLDQQNADKASKSMSIPKAVTNMMARNLGGKTLYKCIHILAITSRMHIVKKHYNAKWIKYALDFDINKYYKYNNGLNFAKYIDHGLRKAFHNAKNMYSYFMTVCKTYYSYALRWFKGNQVKVNGPKIPIFKI